MLLALPYHRLRIIKRAELILANEGVLIVSRALELALFDNANLDVSKTPAE